MVTRQAGVSSLHIYSVKLGPCVCPPLIEQMLASGASGQHRALARETSTKLCMPGQAPSPQTAEAGECYSIHDALISQAPGTLTLKD